MKVWDGELGRYLELGDIPEEPTPREVFIELRRTQAFHRTVWRTLEHIKTTVAVHGWAIAFIVAAVIGVITVIVA